MSDPMCQFFSCAAKATGFCSNCGAAHCDGHAYDVPHGDPYDAGETGLICPTCEDSRMIGKPGLLSPREKPVRVRVIFDIINPIDLDGRKEVREVLEKAFGGKCQSIEMPEAAQVDTGEKVKVLAHSCPKDFDSKGIKLAESEDGGASVLHRDPQPGLCRGCLSNTWTFIVLEGEWHGTWCPKCQVTT